VLFVIRTAGNPFKSRPSAPLVATTLAAVVVGLLLPVTLAGVLGFTVPPVPYFLFLLVAVPAYLEIVKRRVLRLA
jgi:P-type Mg2+ transporter